MDSWPYQINTLFTSANPDSFFASETRTPQNQTGSCQNCVSIYIIHKSSQLCTRSSHRELGCLGSIGDILLSVTAIKVLCNFFKHWLVLKKWEQVGPQGRASQNMDAGFALVLSLVWTCWVDDFKHLSLCSWFLFPLFHYFTASISVIVEYNEIHLFYRTFLVWQILTLRPKLAIWVCQQ